MQAFYSSNNSQEHLDFIAETPNTNSTSQYVGSFEDKTSLTEASNNTLTFGTTANFS